MVPAYFLDDYKNEEGLHFFNIVIKQNIAKLDKQAIERILWNPDKETRTATTYPRNENSYVKNARLDLSNTYTFEQPVTFMTHLTALELLPQLGYDNNHIVYGDSENRDISVYFDINIDNTDDNISLGDFIKQSITTMIGRELLDHELLLQVEYDKGDRSNDVAVIITNTAIIKIENFEVWDKVYASITLIGEVNKHLAGFVRFLLFSGTVIEQYDDGIGCINEKEMLIDSDTLHELRKSGKYFH